VIVGRIGVIIEKIIATAEKIIRIVGGIGVLTKGIFRVTEDTGVTIEEVSRATRDMGVTNEKASKITGDSDVITRGISERIVEFDRTTKDIIPQGQIIGTDTLLNVTDMDIPADLTGEEAGAKLTDVRLFQVKNSGSLI